MLALADLAAAYTQVRETSARRAKIDALTTCLRRAGTEEVPLVVAMLTGELRQGRIGVGYAAVRSLADVPPAREPSLSVRDVDETFDRIAAMSGRGSKAARLQGLTDLLGRATTDEQHFLRRLLIGELRQGALEGVMVEAIALAASVDADGRSGVGVEARWGQDSGAPSR